MNIKSLVGKMFFFLFAIYILIFVNMRLEEQIIPYGNFYVYLYIIALIALLIVFRNKPITLKTKSVSFKTFRLFIVYLIIFCFITYLEEPSGDLGEEMLAFSKYIVVAAITVYFVVYFNLYRELLMAAFVGGSLLLLYEYAIAGFPLDILGRLGTFFSNIYIQRFRLSFNFSNFNFAGNIAACMLLVFSLYFANFKAEKGKITGKTLLLLAPMIFLAVVDLLVLLSSGSRNSMMTLIVFMLACIYFKVTDFDHISQKGKSILKFFIVVFGAVTAYFSLFSSIMEVFSTSGRLNSFFINIPLVIRQNRLLEGLGIMNPGLFGRGHAGYIVDNYYLYVFMETGIIGLVMIAFLLSRICLSIRKIRIAENNSTVAVSAALIAWLVSGIGETCIIYPFFPSSLIFFTIFLSFIELDGKQERL